MMERAEAIARVHAEHEARERKRGFLLGLIVGFIVGAGAVGICVLMR